MAAFTNDKFSNTGRGLLYTFYAVESWFVDLDLERETVLAAPCNDCSLLANFYRTTISSQDPILTISNTYLIFDGYEIISAFSIENNNGCMTTTDNAAVQPPFTHLQSSDNDDGDDPTQIAVNTFMNFLQFTGCSGGALETETLTATGKYRERANYFSLAVIDISIT